MYQADFICTYKLMENEADQEDLYRIQLLQAFDLNEWDDEAINAIILDLYARVSSEFKEIFEKARQNETILEMLAFFKLSGEKRLEENDIIFKLLFKFEYFDLLHRCIVDFLLNQTIQHKYLANLLNIL
jgi:hypothetical protein